jgi:hypothetical protein
MPQYGNRFRNQFIPFLVSQQRLNQPFATLIANNVIWYGRR